MKRITTKYPSKVYIGIDPASQGAVAVLEGNAVTAVILWKKVQRKKKPMFKIQYAKDETTCITKIVQPYGSEIVRTMIELLDFQNKEIHVAIEDAYVGKNRNIAGTIGLSQFSGAIAGCIEWNFPTRCHWVKASVWRKQVLNLHPFTKRVEAKRASLKYIPLLLKGLDVILKLLGEYDHITDAVGVALWLQQKTRSSLNTKRR